MVRNRRPISWNLESASRISCPSEHSRTSVNRRASAPTPSKPSGKPRSIRRSISSRFAGRASSTGRFNSSSVAPEITASGSTPFPLLLLITAPRSSSTVGWMYTSS